nr:trypsin-like peptidase domain-containing protein [uncultured Dysosmobacter sp.]
MDERDEIRREDRHPLEVVETYRRSAPQHLPGEKILTYRRPLPGAAASPSAPPPPPKEDPIRRKRRKRGLIIFLACFGVVAVLAGASWLLEDWGEPARDDSFEQYYDELPAAEGSGEITIPTWPVGQNVSLTIRREHGETLSAQDLYRRVNPSVVMVLAQVEEGASVGTGVIFSADGYLLTNYHVLEGGSDCLVIRDNGTQYAAKYVAGDPDHDLAVLKVDAEGLPAAEFGDSDTLTVGDPVYAIGNPLGVELPGTLTDGIVSAIDRDVLVDGRTMTLIQTNAALNSGNSGGPLINQYGQVVGINVIKMTSEYSNVEGLGFAIPSASAQRIVNDLLTWGEVKPEPRLGVVVLREGVQLENGSWGLVVQEVDSGSAAEAAGVQAGDYILSAGGEDLRTSQDLMRVRRRTYAGDQLPLILWRDGREIQVVLDLEETVAD